LWSGHDEEVALEVLPDRIDLGNGFSLRLPLRSDAAPLIAACQDPEIPRWTTVPSPFGQPEADAFLDRSELWERDRDLRRVYAIADVSDRLVGTVGIVRCRPEDECAEIGYWLAPSVRGRGILTIAGTAVVKAVLSAGYERVDAEVIVGNSASQRVLERIGFTHEGILRSIGSHGTGAQLRRIDVHVYSIIGSDAVAQELLTT
jgi:RimJ/RimL family protein N-acetyltransferase